MRITLKKAYELRIKCTKYIKSKDANISSIGEVLSSDINFIEELEELNMSIFEVEKNTGLLELEARLAFKENTMLKYYSNNVNPSMFKMDKETVKGYRNTISSEIDFLRDRVNQIKESITLDLGIKGLIA